MARMSSDVLARFHPAVRDWFAASFAAPTRAQAEGWPAIARGESTLILAPTGSGKTLTAFLWAINRVMFPPSLAPEPARATADRAAARRRRTCPAEAAQQRRWMSHSVRLPTEGAGGGAAAGNRVVTAAAYRPVGHAAPPRRSCPLSWRSPPSPLCGFGEGVRPGSDQGQTGVRPGRRNCDP